MKKILYMVAAFALCACDPVEEDLSFSADVTTANQINDLVNIEQFDKDGNSAADGNYFKFSTSPAKQVSIITKKDDGSESLLTYGVSGTFTIAPPRGSSNNQTFYIRSVNSDGTCVDVAKEVTVYVQAELTEEVKLLCGNGAAPTSKVWVWDFSTLGTCWGNMGSDAKGSGSDISGLKWWGVDNASGLLDQLGHSVTGTAIGEESNKAMMVFCEDGSVVCYDSAYNEIRKGSFEIADYKQDPAAWKIGTLKTSEGATLFPFEINAGGKYVTEFEIHQLSEDKLVLAYPDGGKWSGDWQEATYWCFSSKESLIAPRSSSKSWTWDDESECGTMWGNMGSDATGDGSSIAQYKWWGVDDASGLLGQLGHSVSGIATGEEDNGAYMTFYADGTIATYDKTGKEIRKSTYEIDLSNFNKWQVGTLKTEAAGTLFPFEINAGGKYVTEYEIHQLSNDKLVLVYPDGGKWTGDWIEATYWCFKDTVVTQ